MTSLAHRPYGLVTDAKGDVRAAPARRASGHAGAVDNRVTPSVGERSRVALSVGEGGGDPPAPAFARATAAAAAATAALSRARTVAWPRRVAASAGLAAILALALAVWVVAPGVVLYLATSADAVFAAVLGAAALATLLAAASWGFTKGEVERIFQFLVPLVLVPVVRQLLAWRVRAPVVIGLLAGQTLLVQVLFDTRW
jgi:hypothetical protein